MKALVTGGAGFIGSNLADELILRNHQVIVVDNLSTGKLSNVSKDAKFYKCDITNKEKLHEVFASEKPDVIFHLAAQINVRTSIADPVRDANVNVLGSINLLNCCREFNSRIIYSSSGGAVYGEPRYLPADESHPISPLSPYGVSKYTVEKYIELYSSLYNLEYTILRYGNVYGPRQDPAGEAGVVAIFTDSMLNNKPLTVFGDGNQTRDFVFVSDVVNANLLALDKNVQDAFNIGTGTKTSVNDIVQSLEKILERKAEVRYSNPIKGEVRDIFLDISKARKHLGFNPKFSLDEGLKLTIRWAKERNLISSSII